MSPTSQQPLEFNYSSCVYEEISFCGISRNWSWGEDLKYAGKFFQEWSVGLCAGEGWELAGLWEGEAGDIIAPTDVCPGSTGHMCTCILAHAGAHTYAQLQDGDTEVSAVNNLSRD